MSASVSYSSPNQFALSITDVTTGKSFSTTQTSSQAQRSSAEWIQEAPSSFFGVLPLANFGKINFSGASATVSGTTGPADNSWAGSTLYQIDMVTKKGSLKATTSALSDSGNPLTSSFSVTWKSSGAGGGGGGHRSANVPPSGSSETALLLAVARLPGAPPAFSATPAPAATVAPPAGVLLPTPPVWTLGIPTFGALAQDTADPDGPGAHQTDSPELSLPGKSALPPTDGLAPPQADQTPANLPGASPDLPWASDAGSADGFWLSAASPGLFDGGQEGFGDGDFVDTVG
jgi:hypothetical protein